MNSVRRIALLVAFGGACQQSEPEPSAAAMPPTLSSHVTPAADSAEVLDFREHGFRIVVPEGWRAAPDSVVMRIRADFDPELMNGHQLLALIVKADRISWDDTPNIRVLLNRQVRTEPGQVLDAVRKAMPSLQVAVDSIIDLTEIWHSASMTPPIWDSRRNTLWTAMRTEGSPGTAYVVGAVRMYRGGQISLYFNAPTEAGREPASRLLPSIIDNMRIPKNLDW